MGKQKWRIIITLAIIALAIVASRKTFTLWGMDETARQEMLERDPDGYKELVSGAMRLGLDLQGGIHTVVRVKLEEVRESERGEVVELVREIIRNRIDPEGVFEPIIQTQGADRIIVDLPGWKDEKLAEKLLGEQAILEFKMLESFENATAVIRKIDSVVAVKNKRGADADSAPETNLAEEVADAGDSDTTDSAGDDNLLAELLGDDTLGADTTALTDDLALDEERPFSGTLMYTLNNSRTGISWPALTFPTSSKKNIQRILRIPEIQRLIPSDMQIAFSTRDDQDQNIDIFTLYFLKDEVRFKGDALENIRVNTDQMGQRTVDFRLSGQAAAKFANLTGNNIDKPFAIVLDDKVESAPFINGRIRTSGQITLGGNAQIEDANTLAIVLKAGSLPAPVEIIEKNLVGPTLGSDSIKKGLNSSLIGLLLVLIYIGIYYRVSGVIANIALLFNLFFLLAMMAGLGATLTMPGIAGIILTIGIAVDANILIFERIREELAVGKNVRAAIDAGYERALLAIVDSHVTTLITAAALFWFGSGPIRGFAVTLFWGVLISLLTAYFVTRMIFDMRKQYKTLSV